MNLLKLFSALGLLCATCSAFADQPQGRTWSFLVPGTTHSGESPLNPNTGWLALRKGENGWELTETTVKARKVASGINTEYDIAITSSHKDAIAMFRLPQLSTGPISTPKLPEGLLNNGFTKNGGKYPSFKVKFNSDVYQFKGGAFPENEEITYDAAIVESGNRKSAIGDTGGDSSHYDSDNNSVRIVWIGDLDKDGKLDLITQVTGTNSSGYCMYLSSEAKETELLGKRVCHEGSGC